MREDMLRRLADVEGGGVPVLSVYLDMRPEAQGERPGARSGLVVLKARLNEIRNTLPERGADVDSFEADAARINEFVEKEVAPQTEGLALFACNANDLFETVEAAVPFENQVTADERADVYQLARLEDEYETSVIAVVDSNTARLFVRSGGKLSEAGGPDDDPVSYSRHDQGGWSQARFSRHIDNHIKNFAGQSAEAIRDLVARVDAQHVILAGDEVAIPPLKDALSREVLDKVRSVVRIGIRAERDDIAEIVEPILAQVEEEEGRSLVGRLVGEVRRGALGAAGLDETKRALEAGQVDTLVIDDQREMPAEQRAELARLAATTSARIEVVSGDSALIALGGVGALLRYRA
jgi:peptide chain release factor subunit 1